MITASRMAIVCSAPIPNLPVIREKIASYPLLIAVDGGANHCHQMGLRPDLLIGDMDSITPDVRAAFHDLLKICYSPDKNETDLELALSHLFHPNIERISVFGALGGRTDHTLGNLTLLARYPGKVFLESASESLLVIPGHTEFLTWPGQTISLIPLHGPARGITTQGLKWALEEGTLDKNFIGMSNVATGHNVSITVKEGDLLCCLNLDFATF
jgi:thiamine pyrophosphokinase